MKLHLPRLLALLAMAATAADASVIDISSASGQQIVTEESTFILRGDAALAFGVEEVGEDPDAVKSFTLLYGQEWVLDAETEEGTFDRAYDLTIRSEEGNRYSLKFEGVGNSRLAAGKRVVVENLSSLEISGTGKAAIVANSNIGVNSDRADEDGASITIRNVTGGLSFHDNMREAGGAAVLGLSATASTNSSMVSNSAVLSDIAGGVNFSNNTTLSGTAGIVSSVTTKANNTYAGARHLDNRVQLSNVTGGIVFEGNTGTTAGGISLTTAGRYYASDGDDLGEMHTVTSALDISGNTGDIVFTNNKAVGDTGGAIHVTSSNAAGTATSHATDAVISITSNRGDIVFDGNNAVQGGAIFHTTNLNTVSEGRNVTSSLLSISDNEGKVTFSNNSTTNNGTNGEGGAIFSTVGGYVSEGAVLDVNVSSSLVISNNAGEVLFENNRSDISSGGAIFARGSAITLSADRADITFKGNLAGNFETGSVRTSAIAADDRVSNGVIVSKGGIAELRAGAGHSVTFYDRVISSSATVLQVNRGGYGGAVTFDGSYAETALAGTESASNYAQRLIDSKYSMITQDTVIYGGSLNVVNGATLHLKSLVSAGASFTLSTVGGGSLIVTGDADVSGLTLNLAGYLSNEATGVLNLDVRGALSGTVYVTLFDLARAAGPVEGTEYTLMNLNGNDGSGLTWDTFSLNKSVGLEYGDTGGWDVKVEAGEAKVYWNAALFVPEPATATLGLLGLASLAMRRRRV